MVQQSKERDTAASILRQSSGQAELSAVFGAAQDRYLADFERFERNGWTGGPSWVHRIRKAAISRFATLGFPTARQEEWKYTSVAPIARIPFKPAGDESDGLTKESVAPHTLGQAACAQLVFVNGRYSSLLSSLNSLPAGVKTGSLAAALDSGSAMVEPYLARHASYTEHPFVALNTAFIQDGAFVFIPEGQVVERPIHLLFVSTAPASTELSAGFDLAQGRAGKAIVSHPRNLILAADDSQATIVESYIGLTGGVYFTNAVTEIVAGENAAVAHYKVQRESEEAFHIATVQVSLNHNSNFSSHSIDLGGALVRNDMNAVLDGQGIDCVLDGLYMVAGRQHVDNHTRIDHVKPHCSSRELYKGVLGGRSKGVFNGKIYVHKDAQKTDAKQTNKNLLLSGDAVVNTKPQLEIYADDVKCTHGSTIGQLDQEAIFYLRSRGIDLEAARDLLTYAFASEMIRRIKVEPIRAQLEGLLLARR
jgi:Fe-S cluster assembly protein SufD